MDTNQPETGARPAPRLRGAERAAALLLAMGKPVAERLLPYFEPSELREISQAAAGLGAIPAAELEALIEDFANQFGVGLNLLVSAREMKDMLTDAIPPEGAGQPEPDPARLSAARTWDEIGGLADETLAKFLADEHPQTVALILSQLAPQKASAMLPTLPGEMRDAAVRRMVVLKTPTEAALMAVAAALRGSLLADPDQSTGADPHEKLARIINNLEPDAMEQVMQGLGGARPQSAERIKGMLFGFGDIPRLAPEARATLFDDVDGERLVLALKGVEGDLREAILSALPSRSRRTIEAELDLKEAVRQRDVDAARREIVNRALALSGQGAIELSASDGDETGLMVA